MAKQYAQTGLTSLPVQACPKIEMRNPSRLKKFEMQRNQSNEEENEVEIGRLIYLSYGPMVSARVIPTLRRRMEQPRRC